MPSISDYIFNPSSSGGHKLGATCNEINRMIFNLDSRKKNFLRFIERCDIDCLNIHRKIEDYIEEEEYFSAKLESKNFVNKNYEKLSISVVVKRINVILELLKTNLHKPETFNAELVKLLTEVDRAIRGDDVKDMDTKLNKLKKYLSPNSMADDDIQEIRANLEASKEHEIERVYREIYDEVNLVSTLAGLNPNPLNKPPANYAQVRTVGRRRKKRDTESKYGPAHIQLN